MADTSAPVAPAASPRRTRWRWIVGGVLAVIALLAGSLYFSPPSFFFTALLKRAVHDQTGTELSVAGARYVIRDIVTVELTGVEIGRPGGAPGTSPLTARKITARLPFRSIISGEPELLSLDLDAPVFNLVRSANGVGNWNVAEPTSTGETTIHPFVLPPTTVRSGTVLYIDESAATELRLDSVNATLAVDPKYGAAAARGSLAYNKEPLTFDLVAADAAAIASGHMTPITLSIDGRVLKAKLSGQAAFGETPLLAGEIEATSPSAHELAAWLGVGDSVPATAGALQFAGSADAQTGAARAVGSLVLHGTPVTYELALTSLRDAIAGKTTSIKGALAGQGIDANIDGNVQLNPAGYSGAVEARTQSIGALAGRLGVANPAIQALGPGSLTGTVGASAGKVSFTDARFDVDGRTGTFAGDVAWDGPRPRVRGNMQISRIDIDALLGRTPQPALAPQSTPADEGFESTFDVLAAELETIENPPPAAAPPGLAAAPAASAWSTAPVDLKMLRAVDLDLTLAIPALKFGQVPLADARLTARLENGELASDVKSVTIGTGKGSGVINVKARGTATDAAIALKLDNVDAEPITAELSGKPLLKGLSTVDIATRASGRSLADLVAALDGHARITMQKGQLRGWDIGQMVAELWNYKGWGYTPSRNTPVDDLTATYTIKAGTITSAPDLTLKGPTAGLRSIGDVVVPRRLIDQKIDVQNLFFKIVIRGDWTKKLWIGPAFFAGLQSAPGAAIDAGGDTTVPASALPKAIPADIAARIERILSDPAASARLTPSQKSFLNALQKGAAGT